MDLMMNTLAILIICRVVLNQICEFVPSCSDELRLKLGNYKEQVSYEGSNWTKKPIGAPFNNIQLLVILCIFLVNQ